MDQKAEPDLLDRVIAKLRENVGQWQQIADASGVPYSTVAKIGQRETQNPRVASVQKLANHFGIRFVEGGGDVGRQHDEAVAP